MKRRPKPRPGKRKNPSKYNKFDSVKHHKVMTMLYNREMEDISRFVAFSQRVVNEMV